MPIEILTLVLIFLSVACATAAVMGLFTPHPGMARLQQALGRAPVERAAAWTEKVIEALAPAGKLVMPSEGWENSPLRSTFVHAGIRSERAVLAFFAAKVLLALGLPGLYMFVSGLSGGALQFGNALLVIILIATVGYYAPNLYLRHLERVRQREVFEKLPDAIDLMTVMVEAGLGLDAAIARVAQEISVQSPVLEDELKLVGLELRAGASREQALRNFAARTGVEEVSLLVSLLVQTDRFGTSMADSLRVHSEALRTKRRLRAEEAAAKISLKLIFPLLFCIFPSIMIVLLGPAVISIYRVFFPIATGR
jgi:tight adherence protein C